MHRKADATPTKDFFVRMITRDISLEDCILDLIDNCLDGAQRMRARAAPGDLNGGQYSGFSVSVDLAPDTFRIADNCGGISIDIAMDHAFHFGRRPDSPTDEEYSIGLYGIGMKRAILKIGKDITIHSATAHEAFVCRVDVDDWLGHDLWEFDMDDEPLPPKSGTQIEIHNLNAGVAGEFADESFVNRLCRIVSRDYARFLDTGFEITINRRRLRGFGYSIREGADFRAFRSAYEDGDVHVEMIAGMAAPPPVDLEPPDRPDTGYYGWFVFCNDRVVLPADKTERTIWGDELFPRWHYQYNGFMGLLLFQARDPRQLPWTTTKRDVDDNSPLYRRAVDAMKLATRPWIEYTNQRKDDLTAAHARERAAGRVPAFEVRANPVLTLPQKPEQPKIMIANILYSKPLVEVNRVRKALGRGNMPYKTVGERTFDYYLENEVED